MFLCHTWVRSQFPEFSRVSSPLRLCLMCFWNVFGTSNLEGPHASLNATNQNNFPNPRDRCFWVHTSCYICDHPTCSQWPCPVMNVVFFHTWYNLSITDLAIQATLDSGLNGLETCFFQNEPLIKSPLFPSFHVKHQSFFLIPHLQSTILIRIATTRKIEQVEIIAISIGFYQLLSFLGLLLYACFYQTQPNSSSGVRWFHAGRRFSQIEEQGITGGCYKYLIIISSYKISLYKHLSILASKNT